MTLLKAPKSAVEFYFWSLFASVNFIIGLTNETGLYIIVSELLQI